MPRGKKPTVVYGKALRSPGERKQPRKSDAFKPQMKKPQGLSEIANYVEENAEYRDSLRELVVEFQEEECDHSKPRVVLADGPTKRLLKCPDCGHIEEKLKAA